ncbi:MAG: hypothetical protein RLZZ366_1101, partial [Pseudomonadota bacterium]
MNEEIERLVVSVRADTQGFARDVSDMRGQLEGPLASGVDRAGAAIEGTLVRAIRTGKLGFEDLKRVALSVLADIASAAIKSGLDAILSKSGAGGRAAACSISARKYWDRCSVHRGAPLVVRFHRAVPIWWGNAGRSFSCPLPAALLPPGQVAARAMCAFRSPSTRPQ